MKLTCAALMLFLTYATTSFSQVLLSTYAGGPAADNFSGAGVAPDGTIVIAGNLAATDLPAFKNALSNSSVKARS